MSEELLLEIGKETLLVVLKLSLPILGVTLVVGIIISIFQAVTQIHELTLTFVPKILATILVIAILGSWMLHTLLDFTNNLFWNLPLFLR